MVSMTGHHLAQFNVALQRFSLSTPDMAEFNALLKPINELAEAAPGFVWRLTGEGSDDATAVRPYGDLVIINYSVWESVEALWNFTYRSGHLAVMQRRRDWFHRMGEPHLVLWWVPVGQRPTLDEGVERLEQLRADGPGPAAFTFRERHPPPAAQVAKQT